MCDTFICFIARVYNYLLGEVDIRILSRSGVPVHRQRRLKTIAKHAPRTAAGLCCVRPGIREADVFLLCIYVIFFYTSLAERSSWFKLAIYCM